MNQFRVWMMTATLIALTHQPAKAALKYTGLLATNPSIDSAFVTATASHSKQFIDFDNDWFVLTPHAFTPIPANRYLSQGVMMFNLDARDVNTEPWTHSPPIGAWHTGFPNEIPNPYSFVFPHPIASFGLFANDLEGPLTATLRFASGTQTFNIPLQQDDGGQFYGFAGNVNEIYQLDFTSGDYHIIDDIQFGWVPEPATALLLAGLSALALRRIRPRQSP